MTSDFSSKNNYLSTPAGLNVDMDYNEVVKRWGLGESIDLDKCKGYYFIPIDDLIPVTLTFYVEEDATITEIELGINF
ncbi:MAG: hypothetical protein IJQ85_06815 [Selenomonadaceae bacterium]|nr:hypothetical protein [Selenomonadaceae bacterium]